MKNNFLKQCAFFYKLCVFLIGATVFSLMPAIVSARDYKAQSIDSTNLDSNKAESTKVDAKKMLTSMSESLRSKNYQGRFMYVVGNDTSSFEVQHAVINGKEYERLVFLNQKQQEIVRVGHDLFCIHPGNHLLREHQKLSANPFADKLAKLNEGFYQNYIFSVDEHQMVAGRDAFKVTFKAKDNNRYDHHLWIDEESKLLLKADISDPMLGTLESFEYVQVTVGKEIPKKVFEHKNFVRHSPKHFVPEAKHSKSIHSNAEYQSSSAQQWEAGWLPRGFYFSGESLQTLKSSQKTGASNKNITMLMYTDGISAITVFVEPMRLENKFNESSQMGALSAFSHSINIDHQSFMITAVGEVQLQTVERVVKGIRLSDSSRPR